MQVRTNFEIGRHIVEYEQQGEHRAEYGRELLKDLSARLTAEFGRGFSKANLEYMRRFFLTYRHRTEQPTSTVPNPEQGLISSDSIAQTLSGQFDNKLTLLNNSRKTARRRRTEPASPQQSFTQSWSHYVFLLNVRNTEERDFYEIEATCGDWSLNELRRQFDTSLYERLALSRDKEGVRQLAREGQLVSRPEDLLKEPYILEFLGLNEQSRYSKTDLEAAIIDKSGPGTWMTISCPKVNDLISQ